MIPIRLTFSGLYSYQKAQTIDFEKLMAAQLFGIFGPVGSGKSTILEAIMFVLFDRSDRLNKSGDNRYYNMLNLQSDKLEIDFTFKTNAQSSTQYRAYFCAKRKKRDFDKVEVKERGQYEWKNERWVPIRDADLSSVLGMTYENFMQTVIIPQGKFREFIDQRPNDRTQMLKELFQLHRFDLGAKTGSLLRKTELAIADLEARLLEIGHISEEEITTQQAELKASEAELSRNQQLAIALDQQCQGLDVIKNLLNKIDDTDQELKLLTDRSEYYDDKEKRLRAYTKAETFFNEKFRLLEETTIEYQRSIEEFAKLEERIETGKNKLQEAHKKAGIKKQEYEQREEVRQQCQDLQHLIQIKKIEPEWRQATERLIDLQKRRTSLEKSLAEQQTQLATYESQLAENETQQAQWHILQEISVWKKRQQELTKEMDDISEQLQKYDKQKIQLQERKESVLTAYGWPGGSQAEELHSDLASFQTELDTQQDALQKEISDLRVQEKLVQAANQLRPGQPCLLCGSTDHPQIIHSPSVKKALTEKQEELGELRQKRKTFLELQQTVQKLISQEESLENLRQHTSERQAALQEKLAQHQQLHHWPEYQSTDSSALKKQLQQMQLAQQRLQNLKQLRQQGTEKFNKVQRQIAELRDTEQTLVQKEISAKAAVAQHQTMLQTLTADDFAEADLTKIEEALQEKQRKLAAIEQDYERSRETLQQYQNALNLLEGRKEVAQESQLKLEQKAEALNQEIQALCVDKDFESVNEVRQLIDLELDTDVEQQAILTYRNKLHNAEVTLHKLQAELQGRTYDADEHRQLQLQAQALTNEVRKQQENCALLRQRIRDWQEKRIRTQTIQEKLAKQQFRESNLKELASLFRGSGFVKYASTVLLENLCRVANHRFMKLTHNSLSLELNGENEFVVRDYLNDGRTRLLKTLSGGQTFQASLCLALALAENVKSLNQADQSFFFLDEGFGSLDKESLRVVFDTLKSLRKENRVVGIISHVEELQHEIDVFLKIEKDRQQGSSIQPSWE